MPPTEEEEAPPCDNLYASNLPCDITEAQVKEIFGDNVIQCKVLASNTPGRGTGVALVRFTSETEATYMRYGMDGGEIEGHDRPIKVRYSWGSAGPYGKAKGKGQDALSPYGAGKGCGKPQANPGPTDNLYVKGLPPGVDRAWIDTAFGEHGVVVTQCRVLPPKTEGDSAHAMVRLQSPQQAINVKTQLNGACIDGSNETLEIDFMWSKFREEPAPTLPQKVPQKGGPGKCACGALAATAAFSYPVGHAKGSGQLAGKGAASYQGDVRGNGDPKGKGVGTSSMRGIMDAAYKARVLPGQDYGNDVNCLFISNLPQDCADIDLYKLFGPFGAITPNGVSAMKNPDGTCKGIGFVNYVDPTAMTIACMALNGLPQPDGPTLKVTMSKQNKTVEPNLQGLAS